MTSAPYPGSQDNPSALRSGRLAVLVPLHPTLYGPLHAVLSSEPVARTWRTRGRLVPTYEFEQFLTRGVAMSCAVATRRGEIVGVVELFDLQQLDRHAQLSVAVDPEHARTGLAMEAAALFLDEVFTRFDLRKIYAHSTESTVQRFGSLLNSIAQVEGVLRDHIFVDGRFEDVTILSIRRDEFARAVGQASTVAGEVWKVLTPPG